MLKQTLLRCCKTKVYNWRILSEVKISVHSKVLGIETSCDDTGCAVVDGNGTILGESLASQNITHLRYGGVNPIVAQELHRDNIEGVVNSALEKSNNKISDVDAIAVTVKPGLVMSLTVGLQYAKHLAKQHNKPIIPIHHMEAHALVARMYDNIPFPFIVLLISGGHCLLALVNDINEFLLLGKGIDNAPGEVLDKVARRVKLKNIPDYSKCPGGQAIELAARKAKNPEQFSFTIPLLKNRDCNFSFSGLKDSCVRKLIKKEEKHNIAGDGIIPEVNDLCAAFQNAVTEHLLHRTERAIHFCEKRKLIGESKHLVVSGGVACNDFIFKSIESLGAKIGYSVHRPPSNVCTDNGIMIAWNGVEKLKKQLDILQDVSKLKVEPVSSLGINLIDDVISENIAVKVTRLKRLK